MEARRKIKIDELNRPVLSVEQCVDLILDGKSLDDCVIDDNDEVCLYNKNAEIFGIDPLKIPENLNIDEFNKLRSSQWLIPDKYKNIDIKGMLISKCTDKIQLDRVEEEYSLYEKYDLLPVLRCLIYILDIFRENKYVWGVGRGSSVSSYCLYLLGVHKIDSIKYGLNIKEFLKDE